IEQALAQTATAPGTSGAQPQIISTATVFQVAQAANMSFGYIGPTNLSLLGTLNISADAKARITAAIQNGYIAYMPLGSVTIGGVATTAWYEINPETGETTGVTEDGGHQAMSEYAALLVGAPLIGYLVGQVLKDKNVQIPQWAVQLSKVRAYLTFVALVGGVFAAAWPLALAGILF